MKHTRMRFFGLLLAILWACCAVPLSVCAEKSAPTVTGRETSAREASVLEEDAQKQLTEEDAQVSQEDALLEAADLPGRRVLTECLMDQMLQTGDEFVLKATLVGFEDVEVDVQWQLDTGDGQGFRDAIGESKALTYRVPVSRETVKALWRIVVTVVE